MWQFFGGLLKCKKNTNIQVTDGFIDSILNRFVCGSSTGADTFEFATSPTYTFVHLRCNPDRWHRARSIWRNDGRRLLKDRFGHHGSRLQWTCWTTSGTNKLARSLLRHQFPPRVGGVIKVWMAAMGKKIGSRNNSDSLESLRLHMWGTTAI